MAWPTISYPAHKGRFASPQPPVIVWTSLPNTPQPFNAYIDVVFAEWLRVELFLGKVAPVLLQLDHETLERLWVWHLETEWNRLQRYKIVLDELAKLLGSR